MSGNEEAWCAECTRSFTRRSGRGRPARYCGTVCRRAAEYELNRAQGLLRRAEQRHQDAGLKLALADRYRLVEAEKAQKFWASEVERLRGELRRLLEASETVPAAPKSA